MSAFAKCEFKKKFQEFNSLQDRIGSLRVRMIITGIAFKNSALLQSYEYEKLRKKDQSLLMFTVEAHYSQIKQARYKEGVPLRLLKTFFKTSDNQPNSDQNIGIQINSTAKNLKTRTIANDVLKTLTPEDVVALFYALNQSNKSAVINEKVFHGGDKNRNVLLSIYNELNYTKDIKTIWINYLEKNELWKTFKENYPDSLTSSLHLIAKGNIEKKILKTWTLLKKKNDGFRSIKLKKGKSQKIKKSEVKRTYVSDFSSIGNDRGASQPNTNEMAPENSKINENYRDVLGSVSNQNYSFDVRRNVIDEIGSIKSESKETNKTAKDSKKQSVEVREGAQYFRENILRIYNRTCCVSGSKIVAVLEAAHIKDHHESKNNDLRNGLCLRSDIHTLFDRGLLKIDTNYSIQLDDSIKDSEYGKLEGQKINLPDHEIDYPKKTYIKWKFDKFYDD